MSTVEQLELQLWASLSEAAQVPEAAELAQLWQLLDITLVKLDTPKQLQVAAEAIAQIAEVFQERSTLIFEELEAATSEDGPIMPADAFDRYVRQTMTVDFEQFIESPTSLLRKAPQRCTERFAEDGQSVVGELNQAVLLQALDEQMTQAGLTEVEAFNRALEIAHDEDVSEWTQVISRWLEQPSTVPIALPSLQKAVKMPLVQLWLALLLGNYQIEQRGEFYDNQHIWIIGHD